MKLTIKSDGGGFICVRKEHERYQRPSIAWVSFEKFLGDQRLIVSDRKFAGASRVILTDAISIGKDDPDIGNADANYNCETRILGSLVRVCKSGITRYGFGNKRVFYVKKMDL